MRTYSQPRSDAPQGIGFTLIDALAQPLGREALKHFLSRGRQPERSGFDFGPTTLLDENAPGMSPHRSGFFAHIPGLLCCRRKFQRKVRDNERFIDHTDGRVGRALARVRDFLRPVTLAGAPFSLRPYQREAADLFHLAGAERDGSGVIVLPCGAGKTIVGAQVMNLVRSST